MAGVNFASGRDVASQRQNAFLTTRLLTATMAKYLRRRSNDQLDLREERLAGGSIVGSTARRGGGGGGDNDAFLEDVLSSLRDTSVNALSGLHFWAGRSHNRSDRYGRRWVSAEKVIREIKHELASFIPASRPRLVINDRTNILDQISCKARKSISE
jgi:hypothetical protein